MSVVVMDPDELRQMIADVVARTVTEKVPEIVKSLTQDEYLTTEDVEAEFKISKRSQKHYRDSRQIPFTKHQRKIFYRREDVERFMESNRIPAR